MTDNQREMLIVAARLARERAYAKYSNFAVGAAVLTSSGEVVAGCNVENASFGLTLCAERVALATAVTSGHRHFDAMAVATVGGQAPCGACRQFAAEFCEDLPVLLVDVDRDTDETGSVRELRLSDLLPGRFCWPA